MCLRWLVVSLGLLAADFAVGADEHVDRLGDPLPIGAIQRLGTLRLRYRGGVADYCYLPDGRAAVATGSRIDLWDMRHGKLQASHQVANVNLRSVRCRDDGRALLLADAVGNVHEWDLLEERESRVWPTGQKSLVEAIYSPDAKRVLTIGSLPPTLKQWDLETGKQLVAIAQTGGMVVFTSVVYGPDGRTAWVGGGREHVLEQYDLATGRCLRELFGDYTVYDMTLSADRRRLLAGSRHRASEWDLESGDKLAEFSGHHGHAVPSVAYCRDGNQILTGSRDGSIRRWDRQQGTVLRRWFAHQGHVSGMRVSPDGQWVLSYGDGALVESSVETGKPRIAWDRHDGAIQAVAFLPDGRRAVSGSADGTLRVWDVASGKTIVVIEGAKLGAYAVAVSPGGPPPNVGTRALPLHWAAAGCKDGCVRVFSLANGKLLRELSGHRGFVRAVAYAPDAKRLLSGGDDGAVLVWTRDKNQPVARLKGHRGGVLSVAVSPDRRQALSGGRDGTVRLWDLTTGNSLATYQEAHRGWVECVRFIKDGREALSAGRDGRIVQWELKTGKTAQELSHQAWIRALVVSADGSRAYSGAEDGTIIAWDLQTGRKVAAFTGHEGPVLTLALSPDGRTLVSGSQDATLLVWNAP